MRKALSLGLMTTLLLALCPPAGALVLHPEQEPAPNWVDHPADATVGQWQTNASAVAVGLDGWAWTDYVVTTRHQYGGIGSQVYIDGHEYHVAEIWNSDSSDIRVCRLIDPADGKPAGLSAFTGWYAGTNETQHALVGAGFGEGRGEKGYNYYEWAGPDTKDLRWGTNLVESVQSDYPCSPWTTDVLVMDFDAVGAGSSFEGALATGDSGGGWFLREDDRWKLAGLGAYVSVTGRSHWSGVLSRNRLVRVSAYDDFLTDVIAAQLGLLAGDIDNDGSVGAADLGILARNFGSDSATWSAGDLDRDGQVSAGDLGELARNFSAIGQTAGGEHTFSRSADTVPAPAGLAIWLGAWGVLLRRRRRRSAARVR